MTSEVISRTLGVNQETLEAMLEQLTTAGYLQDLVCSTRAGSAHGCHACISKGGCNFGLPSHIWALTEKGSRAAQRQVLS